MLITFFYHKVPLRTKIFGNIFHFRINKNKTSYEFSDLSTDLSTINLYRVNLNNIKPL